MTTILKPFKIEGEIDQKNSCDEDRSVNRVSHRTVDSKMEGNGIQQQEHQKTKIHRKVVHGDFVCL